MTIQYTAEAELRYTELEGQAFAAWRAKYSQSDRDDMAANGKAMTDGSYPIADEEDLDNAIRAVGRGKATHDTIRKHIMERAKALGLTSKIPDNWNADGSLAADEKALKWDAERRDTTPSYLDMREALSNAVADKYGDNDDTSWGPWVEDFGPDWVVFTKGGEQFKSTYTFDGLTVTLSNKTAVRPVTTYVPMETDSQLPDAEHRVKCPLCDGEGKIREGNVKCPKCSGTGNVTADEAETKATPPAAWSTRKAVPALATPKVPWKPAAYDATGEGDGEPVRCPACDKGDSTDARFCDQCGYGLVGRTVTVTGKSVTDFKPKEDPGVDTGDAVVCPTCSKGDAVDAQFCDQCGFKLAGALGVTPSPSAKKAAADEPETKSARRRTWRRAKRTLERAPEYRRTAATFERRVATSADEIVLTGWPIRYTARYDVRDIFGVFRENMMPGAAATALDATDFDCRFLTNHDGMPLARTLSGTLELETTPRGLRSVAHLDSRSQAANDLAVAVERGDVNQMSIGFMVATGGDAWRIGDDGIEERTISAIGELFDVSAVTYPASPTTSIELAQRTLMHASAETRERIRRLFQIGAAARSGSPLSQKDGEELRAVAESLYRAEEGAPPAIILDVYERAVATMERALRAGKVLSSDNQAALQAALDALHEADVVDIPGITKQLEAITKALDAGQAGLAQVLGKVNPDGGPSDLNPTLVPSTEGDDKKRQAQHLEVVKARRLLR